jgi:hypothetical protein
MLCFYYNLLFDYMNMLYVSKRLIVHMHSTHSKDIVRVKKRSRIHFQIIALEKEKSFNWNQLLVNIVEINVADEHARLKCLMTPRET